MTLNYQQNLIYLPPKPCYYILKKKKKIKILVTIQYDSKCNIGLIIGGIIKKLERKTKKKCEWTLNLHYLDHKAPISCSKFQSQLSHLTIRYCMFQKHASSPSQGGGPPM